MNIGIFTYGTRGDLQPYIALAHGLIDKGHSVSIAATADFKSFVEGFGITFLPLFGEAESMMNAPEGQTILKTENSIKLMQYYFKVLHENRVPLRKSYIDAISNVDYIIANAMTLPIVSTIAEKQQKPMAITYFMPPVVGTAAFPLSDFDFLNFPWYNRFTYKIAHYFFWAFNKKDTNAFRDELGLPLLKQNLIQYLDDKKVLDLYCLSPALIPEPNDWESHHKITGFLTVPPKLRTTHAWDKTSEALLQWLTEGPPPIYIGFGSNGVGNTLKIKDIIFSILDHTDERILFCTGWSAFDDLPTHKNLYVLKYVNHEVVFPFCKVGVFHGGAGTLAAMLRHNLPLIVISFYTDQPTWGKIVERKQLGVHIPIKKITIAKFMDALEQVNSAQIQNNVKKIGAILRTENGTQNAINAIEDYFSVTHTF
ncbi:MAG: glycosyltransferase family 1 protein [Chitinophagales bacterium]|nr:glycosyltransferase family 1 protein [Chitinophagales bacterium]